LQADFRVPGSHQPAHTLGGENAPTAVIRRAAMNRQGSTHISSERTPIALCGQQRVGIIGNLIIPGRVL
jgi:hypothetical protein